jgi:hypothetical protein
MKEAFGQKLGDDLAGGATHQMRWQVDARRQHADLIAAPALRIDTAPGHLAGGSRGKNWFQSS